VIQHALTLPLPSTSAEGRRARDRGIAKTSCANREWLDDAEAGLRRYSAGRAEVTIEGFRHWWLEQGGAAPTSHNAWGALGHRAARSTFLKFARFEQAKSPQTRAHPIRVYTVAFNASGTAA
jgi:hypothetical protein